MQWCFERKCVDIGGRPEAVNGEWGGWSSWSECSRTCGGGASYMERMCDNPTPANHGRYCIGARRKYKLCNTEVSLPLSSLIQYYQMTEAFTAGVMIFIEQFRARWPWYIGVLEF